jgi:hypothetical protein
MRPFLLLGLLALPGCAASAPPTAVRPVATTLATSQAFREWEAGWLDQLAAADPRIAMRLPAGGSKETAERVAAAAAVRGEPDLGIVGGAIDVFSFDDRERQLRSLRAALREAPDDGTPQSRDERELLGRLVDGEELRVERERVSPGSASERVRAIVLVWGSPRSPREVDERERLIARGLLPVEADVRAGRLDRARSLELEDALDALERLAVPEGYPETTKLIASLRVELDRRHPPAPVEAQGLTRELAAYLGVHDDRSALALRLAAEEQTLRGEATGLLSALPASRASELRGLAARHVEEESSCPVKASSVVRSMAPPPERALLCEPLMLARNADGADDRAVLALVLHDDAAIALWALGLDEGATDLDATRTAHPLLSSVPPDRQDRLVRAALVSAARLVAPGVAVTVLDAEGPDGRRERATRWVGFGDAPLDLVSAFLK